MSIWENDSMQYQNSAELQLNMSQVSWLAPSPGDGGSNRVKKKVEFSMLHPFLASH